MNDNHSSTIQKGFQPDWPTVTVAVCVRNGEATIRACLDSLIALDYPREKVTLLVIDNGSTDDTPVILRQYAIQIEHEPEPGRGNARNRAVAVCSTPLLAFTDADCTVSQNWLKEIVPVFADPTVGMAGGNIVTPGDDALARFFELRQIVSNREFSGDYSYSPPFLATANTVFRLDAVREVNGFRPEYRVAEDADLCWRLQDRGYRLIYIEGGIVFHHHRTTVRAMFSQAIDYGHDGVHVYIVFHPEVRLWIWWGLYARLVWALVRSAVSPLVPDPFKRTLPRLDAVRYTGLALGRLQAAIQFRRWIL
ncbi:glycosyltransferase [bacterium]|nr:glycosyltransferase [candidate division CSSED10-310 bacterium]